MKDIPLFTAASGIASLILREIPTRREAYIQVRSVFTSPAELLHECESFCRAAGAEQVYFGGKADFSAFRVHARLVERRILRAALPKTDAVALPTAEPAWAALYNARFAAVPAACTYEKTPESGAYYILRGQERIGLGLLQNDQLCAVAALKRGSGADCVCALAARLAQSEISLLCAEQNVPAMRLYDRLGFSSGMEKEVWYAAR